MTQPAHNNRPVTTFGIGRVKATIWRNKTEDGQPRYNVVVAPPLQRRRFLAVHPELRPERSAAGRQGRGPRAHARVRALGERQRR